MGVSFDPARQSAALAAFFAAASGAEAVAIRNPRLLTGGAIQQNWALDLDLRGGARSGELPVVMRLGNPAGIPESRPRHEEFALLQAAFALGAKVPEPLFLDEDGHVLGVPFAVFRRLPGSSDPRRLLRSLDEEGGAALAKELAREMARLHSLAPERAPAGLAFLDPPKADFIPARIAEYRRRLDAIGALRPVLEWALAWAEAQNPGDHPLAFCHRDFRTGNYLVAEGRLSGLLDFEFAGWSDPHEDLGWFLARCWRFGAYAREAGGIATREVFLDAYRAASPWPIDLRRLQFWEILAALRWAVIALEQGARNRAENLHSLELGLTEFRALEAEYDALVDIAAWGAKS